MKNNMKTYTKKDIAFVYKGTNTLPERKTSGSAGIDLQIEFPEWTEENPYLLEPFQSILVPTGMYLGRCVPELEVQIRSRSGLSLKYGIVVLNAPATIDSDYRGELKVILYNSSPTFVYPLVHGLRCAQMIISEVITFEEVPYTLDIDPEPTTRGEGGFGHTGLT